MTFGEKIKKLRTDNHLTQENLADRVFVTRSAVSKWENGGGYPGIDSLKLLSSLFGISIDELISDEDVENKKLLEEKAAKKMYILAVLCLAATTALALAGSFLKMTPLIAAGTVFTAGYVIFGLLSKPKYKRLSVRRMILPYIISRGAVLLVVIGAAVYTLLTL